MPAITPADLSVLPRLTEPDPTAVERPTVKVVTGYSTLEGEGFPVRRPFPGKTSLTVTDPFLLFDHMGAVEYAPGEPKGTPWHPHRGFETVTYIMDGAFAHQDSTGGGGLISNGDTQWMTAGSGLLHIETPPESLVVSGGLFHGVQIWVNLPKSLKWTPPRYQDIRGSNVEMLSSSDGGALVRVIAGDLGGFSGPGVTWTPIVLAPRDDPAGRRAAPAVAARTSTHSSTRCRGAARPVPTAHRWSRASWRCWARETCCPYALTRHSPARPPRWTSWSSVASPSGSRSSTTGRSS